MPRASCYASLAMPSQERRLFRKNAVAGLEAKCEYPGSGLDAHPNRARQSAITANHEPLVAVHRNILAHRAKQASQIWESAVIKVHEDGPDRTWQLPGGLFDRVCWCGTPGKQNTPQDHHTLP